MITRIFCIPAALLMAWAAFRFACWGNIPGYALMSVALLFLGFTIAEIRYPDQPWVEDYPEDDDGNNSD